MNARSLPLHRPRRPHWPHWQDIWSHARSARLPHLSHLFLLSHLPRLVRSTNRASTVEQTHFAEVITPRVGQPDALALENLLQSLLLSEREPVALEVWGTPTSRHIVIRASSARGLAHVAAQLRAHIPQAEVRLPLPTGEGEMPISALAPTDPLRVAASEDVCAVKLVPREGTHLPLKLYDDRQLGQTGVDPLLGVLAAMRGLPDGCRVVAQLALAPAPEAWSRSVQRLAVEHPLAQERARETAQTSAQVAHDGGSWTSGVPLLPLLAVVALVILGQRVLAWYAARDIRHLLLVVLVAAALVAGAFGFAALRLRRRGNVYSMRLVDERTLRLASRTHLTLAAIGPSMPVGPAGPVEPAPTISEHTHPGFAPPTQAALVTVLDQLVAAYRQHALATGNGLVVHSLRRRRAAHLAASWGRWARRSRHLLTVRELAALWHLPAGDAAVPLLERTRAKRLLAPAIPLATGYRLGMSDAQGHVVPVSLPGEALRRNALLVAKTGKGKSTLLQHLALGRLVLLDDDPHAAHRTESTAGAAAPAVRNKPGLVVVDPHGDLIRGLLPLVPAPRRDEVVLVDLADTAYPVALNPLDALLGRDRDKAVESLLAILSQIWSKFWGPRMQNALEYALKTLYEANEELIAADPQDGPDRQFTLLDVAPILTTPSFRKDVLVSVRDLTLRSWWKHYYDALDPRLRTEIINPVLTKMAAFSGSRVARRIVGQGRSTLDLAEIVREGRVLLVNTARGVVGADTATLVGATLLGTLAVALEEQARQRPEERRHLLLVVDEFQTLLGVDYGAMLSELRKFGGTFALATQALAHLDALDPTLRPTVLANVDALYVFATSAEDARVLVHELDDAVEVADLINLDDFTCYAKLTLDGRRLPVFSLALDPPPVHAHGQAGEPEAVQHLKARARTRYARPIEDVDEALTRAAGRYTPPHEARENREREQSSADGEASGVPSTDGNGAAGDMKPRGRGRRGWRRPADHEVAAARDLWAGLGMAAGPPGAARHDRASDPRDARPDDAVLSASEPDDDLTDSLPFDDDALDTDDAEDSAAGDEDGDAGDEGGEL